MAAIVADASDANSVPIQQLHEAFQPEALSIAREFTQRVFEACSGAMDNIIRNDDGVFCCKPGTGSIPRYTPLMVWSSENPASMIPKSVLAGIAPPPKGSLPLSCFVVPMTPRELLARPISFRTLGNVFITLYPAKPVIDATIVVELYDEDTGEIIEKHPLVPGTDGLGRRNLIYAGPKLVCIPPSGIRRTLRVVGDADPDSTFYFEAAMLADRPYGVLMSVADPAILKRALAN